ncbi:MAG: putative cytokinetic ring protein SteA [Syntrophomonadaceae bacterium]|nr:putative cytokinetic ring protein SteA [Syntrophomonadaceae bacterium]
MHLKGKARLDLRTKNLVKRLRRNDIAFINHDDIDEVAAMGIIEARPQAVVNADASITGRYPTRGVLSILKAGIPVIDRAGTEPFERIREGMIVELRDGQVFREGQLVATGHVLTIEDVEAKLEEARHNFKGELDRFVENTLEYARREKGILLGDVELPPLATRIKDRPALVVVRGKNYREDLRAIASYIQDEKPVRIGVDGGADALLEEGFRPDIIVGDMDSVSDQALRCGAEIVVHAYPDGRAPGLQRVREMGLEAKVVPMTGTSEDLAMMLAFEKGASLLVAVGTHSSMIDFLEKGRRGMASTFLVRLRVGSILVDAKGVSQLYRQSLRAKHVAQLLVAALVPILIILWVSPSTRPFFQLLALQLKLLLGW